MAWRGRGGLGSEGGWQAPGAGEGERQPASREGAATAVGRTEDGWGATGAWEQQSEPAGACSGGKSAGRASGCLESCVSWELSRSSTGLLVKKRC